MPIGEFGGAPPLVAEGSPALTTPMYWMYEMAQASLNPARAMTDATKILFQNPLNPWSHTDFGKSIAAGCELFERTTRRYGKPEWGLHDTEVNGVRTPIEIRSVWEKPFCRLLYFDRKLTRPLRDTAAAGADRGADVRSLRDLAARHGRGVPADPRGLHHRLVRCPDGAGHRRPLRPR